MDISQGDFILGILMLFIVYFIFELNVSLLNGAKDLRIEIAKIRISDNEFRKTFLETYLDEKVGDIHFNVVFSYFSLSMLFLIFLRPYDKYSLVVIFALMLISIYNNTTTDNSVPVCKAMVLCENFEQLAIQIMGSNNQEKHDLMLGAYRILKDDTIELNVEEKLVLKEVISMYLP